MNILRLVFLLGIVVCFAVAFLVMTKTSSEPRTTPTLSPLFQQLGKPLTTLERSLDAVYPVDALDEKALGEEIRKQLRTRQDAKDAPTIEYLNALARKLTENHTKPFEYTVVLCHGYLNAYALPGGVIKVTRDLIPLLQTEAEIVAVLSHEIGHIERGHAFERVRHKLLQRKIGPMALPSLVTQVLDVCPRIVYNRTQEAEADAYAFELLSSQGYDLDGAANTLKRLLMRVGREEESPNIVSDFLHTHPYTELRIAYFESRAEQFRTLHPSAKEYCGARNYQERKTRVQQEYPAEFR